MTYYLAVDIGASSGRHILGSIENGRLVLEEVYRFENGIHNENGTLVWDAENLVCEVKAGIKKCKEIGKIPETVAIDTWGVDYLLLDENKKELLPAVSYRDSRTEKAAEEVGKILPQSVLYYSTGIQKQNYNTIYQLYASPDSITHLAYIEQTYWKRRLKSRPLLLPDEYKDSFVQNHNGLLISPHISVLMLCDNRWNVPKSDHKMPVDYLHICKGFKGSLHSISKAFQPKLVVLDASLTSFYRNKYTKEVEEIGWEIYDMHEQGALKIECK